MRATQDALVRAEPNLEHVSETLDPAQAILKAPSVWRIVLTRLAELLCEFPRIVRGLTKLWSPFVRRMVAIFLMNAGIAAWETTLTVAAAVQLNALAQKWSYLEIVGVITVTVIAFQGLHEAVFPYIRERYILKNFRVDFPMHVAMLSIRRNGGQGVVSLPANKKTPLVQAGCPAAYTLTEMLLRDPAFAVRGIILMVFFWITNPFLMTIGTIGMVLDLIVVLYMDAKIYDLNERRQRSENELWGHVIHTLDAEAAPSRHPAVTEKLIERCEQAWRDFKDVTVQLGMQKLFLNEAVRNPISLAIRWGTMLIIGWSVSKGDIEVGSFLMYVGLIGNAGAPFHIVYAFQKQIMDTRPALRQLGTLCGIDFGIMPPKYAAG
jgi:ABC-type multidrug transport system fused ATPase/permease subunit